MLHEELYLNEWLPSWTLGDWLHFKKPVNCLLPSEVEMRFEFDDSVFYQMPT